MIYKICEGDAAPEVIDADGDLWLISGRVPFDDEDTTFLYLAKSAADVEEAFTAFLYQDADEPEVRKADNEKAHGAAVYTNICQRVATKVQP